MNNFIGKKVGRLTVIEEIGEVIKNGKKYLCKCDCGNECEVLRCNLYGGTRSCGCLNKEARIKLGLSKRKLPPDLASGKAMFDKTYLDGDLTFKQFIILSKQNCFYCGEKPNNYHNKYANREKWAKYSELVIKNGTFVYNGLDRINPLLPHNYDNVVPCCFICNRAKSNMSINDFDSWIYRLYKILIKK